MWPNQFKMWLVAWVVFEMLHIVSLRARFENFTDEMQRSLIQELMLYEFKLAHNTVKVTKSICVVNARVHHIEILSPVGRDL